MEESKKELKKVDFLNEEDQITFNLSKNEALERLKEEKVTESEQMLTKWCREGTLHAVRVVKGDVKDRGLRISQKSLESFILMKTGRVETLLDELIKLKAENKELKKEIKELKESGLRKPRATTVSIKEPFLFDNKLSFRMDRAKHQAFFKENELVKVERNSRTGFVDVTDKITNDEKEAIMEAKKKLNR